MNYIEEAFKHFNMNKCKMIIIPSNVNTKFLRLSDVEFGNVHGALEDILYNAGVGSLMYAMMGIKADLASGVSMVDQFMFWVGPPHWLAVKCIMSYLKGTLETHWRHIGICLRGKDIDLKGFVMPIEREMQTIEDPSQRRCFHRHWIFLAEMQETTKPLHYLYQRWNTWPLTMHKRGHLTWATFGRCEIRTNTSNIHHV